MMADKRLDLWKAVEVAAVLLVLGFFLFRWLRKRALAKPRQVMAKSPREVALDVLHDLKENHVKIPAHEVAARAQPVFRDYLEAHGDNVRERGEQESLEKCHRLLGECDILRFSRTPDADSRRQPLIESMLEFVREDPFRATIDAEPITHTPAA